MPERSSDATPARQGLPARIRALIERVQRWKPVRVWTAYSTGRGPLLAAGLAYYALFAGFAALWAAFSIAGAIISGNVGLRTALLQLLSQAVPGLLKDESGQGAIDPEILLTANIYGISGIVALVVVLFSALTGPGAARKAVRMMFRLPVMKMNALLLRLRDLGFGVGLGLLALVAAVLAIAATSAAQAIIDWLGLGPDSAPAVIAGRGISLLATLLVEAIALFGVYRMVAGVRLPGRLLLQGVLIGTVGLGAITLGGSLLLGGASNNPLIASFSVLAGLLLFFFIAGQVVLVAAAWMAVSAEDAGIELDVEEGKAAAHASERRQDERSKAP